MLYDLIYPEDEGKIRNIPCIVATSYFNADELTSFGVDRDGYEVDEAFIDFNEFEKTFKLWESPAYLRKFFKDYGDKFKDEYWAGITEEEFVVDVTRSVNRIKAELLRLFKGHEFHTVTEPLDIDDKENRLCQSIRVKIKQGWIHRRLAFRFYAVEIEEEKCYQITGAAIKVDKDMMKADNTTIEMLKVNHALNELASNGINTKELFIDFVLE